MEIRNRVISLFSDKSSYTRKILIRNIKEPSVYYKLINRPHGMLRNDLKSLSEGEWCVTDKADGEHMLINFASEDSMHLAYYSGL